MTKERAEKLIDILQRVLVNIDCPSDDYDAVEEVIEELRACCVSDVDKDLMYHSILRMNRYIEKNHNIHNVTINIMNIELTSLMRNGVELGYLDFVDIVKKRNLYDQVKHLDAYYQKYHGREEK